MNKTKSNKKKSCCQVSILESENWMRHATRPLFGPVSRCVRICREQREQTPARPIRADLGRIRRFLRGRKSKQEKALALSVRQGGHNRPQCGRFQEPGADAFAAGENCH